MTEQTVQKPKTSLLDFDRVRIDDDLKFLKTIGLNWLTGESCGYSMRILFDVETEHAKELLESFFGTKLELHPKWNKGIGSIMLSRGVIKDFIIFASLQMHKKYSGVVLDQPDFHPSQALYLVLTDELLAFVKLAETQYGYKAGRLYWNQPTSRNTHQFTGRYN